MVGSHNLSAVQKGFHVLRNKILYKHDTKEIYIYLKVRARYVLIVKEKDGSVKWKSQQQGETL